MNYFEVGFGFNRVAWTISLQVAYELTGQDFSMISRYKIERVSHVVNVPKWFQGLFYVPM